MRLQQLESRQLLAADAFEPLSVDPLDVASQVSVASSVSNSIADAEQSVSDSGASWAEQGIAEQGISLPQGLPAEFSVEFRFGNETHHLQLSKHSVFGPNTRFLVDEGSGQLTQVDPGADRSYVGTVVGQPTFVVTAWLTEDGLHANIIRPGQASLIIAPSPDRLGSRLHSVSIDEATNDPSAHDHDGDGVPDHAPEDHPNGRGNGHGPGCSCSACCSTSFAPSTAASEGPVVVEAVPSAATQNQESIGGATLAPSRVIDVREFEIGVEIGSAAFLNNYSGMAQVQSVVAGIPANLDARYLHSTGIKFRLGTVIVRQSAAEDPFNVANGNDNGGLSAFRNYWNSNPGEVGNTHDLAVYHVRASPSGLAYVNNVGTSFRYLLSASNGATSWADGTLAHEVGHQWNLRHVGDVGSMFYEARPRSNGNAPGGANNFISIMHGSGTHNIGRMATDEANRVYAALQNKLQFGDIISAPVEIKPFGHRDSAVSTGQPIVLDVIANDYDANNDVLNVQLRDTVSHLGGTISLSAGTGPGGRDEIIYTPPANTNGEDFFHYNVVDASGRTDFAAVNVQLSGPTKVDLNQTQYLYDLGTSDSAVFGGYQRISPENFGDLGFETDGPNAIESRDREENGQIAGVNDLNRDHIRMRSPSRFHHRLDPGLYNVLFTVGDATENTSGIRLTAEDSVSLTTATHGAGNFTNYTLQNVPVIDGELNIDIENLGFSANITRIIITQTETRVDTDQPSYSYDFGSSSSPVLEGDRRITPDTIGDINWSGGSLNEVDRGSSVGNEAYQDLVFSNGTRSLNHKIADGIWRVTLNMGDTFLHDQMGVRAEGTVVSNSITSPVNQYSFVDENGASVTPTSFDVVVSDGELNLEFSDNGGSDVNWVLNRMVLEKVGIVVDTSQTEYAYDFGGADSPVAENYTQITPDFTAGDVNWTGGTLDFRDRGPDVDDDALRDFVFASSSRTFSHAIANGAWKVTLVMGDTTLHDNMSVRAEGDLISDSITSTANEYNYVDQQGASATPTSFIVNVTDGELNLEFDDVGGSDANWVLNRLSLEKGTEVDLAQTAYFYDLGTPTSPVFSGNLDPYQRLSPETFGDLAVTSDGPNPVESRDRIANGSAQGNPNDLNRDHLRLRSASEFRHKLAIGLYDILLTVGDAAEITAPIRFTAEDSVELTTVQHAVAAHTNYVLQNVPVVDGELNLDIENLGFTANLNRIRITRQATSPPELTSFTRYIPSEQLTNADTLVFRATFDKEVVGVDATDFAVNGSTATVSSVMPVQGTGESVYEVTVTGGDLQSRNGIVGIDLAAGQDITDVTLNPLPSDEPSIDETFTLDNIAPEVTDVTIDDGTQQRSVVRSIAIDFDSDISFAAGAVELRNSGGTLIDTTSSVAAGTVTSQVVLTFPGTTGGSLDDANYQLTVKRELVKDAAGNTLENDRVDDFFRFFGDTDGDRDVDGQDYGRFGLAFLKSAGQDGFNSALDLDNDGDVDGQDYGNFGSRFLTTLMP